MSALGVGSASAGEAFGGGAQAVDGTKSTSMDEATAAEHALHRATERTTTRALCRGHINCRSAVLGSPRPCGRLHAAIGTAPKQCFWRTKISCVKLAQRSCHATRRAPPASTAHAVHEAKANLYSVPVDGTDPKRPSATNRRSWSCPSHRVQQPACVQYLSGTLE